MLETQNAELKTKVEKYEQMLLKKRQRLILDAMIQRDKKIMPPCAPEPRA
jgi:hypothetical protein